MSEDERIMRETRCYDCKYQSHTYGSLECSKCGGKLEILASTDKKEISNE